MNYPILWAICSTFATGMRIWDLPGFAGPVPIVNVSSISAESFFRRYKIAPFVVRSFHENLGDLQVLAGGTGEDPFIWLENLLGESSRISLLEGELEETRLAPSVPEVKWKYFFERFRLVDMYAVSRPPEMFRSRLSLFPFLACGGLSSRMLAPFIWLSGGLKSSKSVVHMDSQNNQHCVLAGSKRFLLIPPFIKINSPEYGWIAIDKENPPVGYEGAYGEFVANFNPENVDLETYPVWEKVPWLSAELHAGDCIYMPEGWFHYVESQPEPTLSWHVWFDIPTDLKSSEECEQRPLKVNECVFFSSNSTSNCWKE